MFQLEHEVRNWCASINADGCARDEHLEELEDHLLSEIERLHEMANLVMIPLWFASYLLITNSFRALRRES